MIKTSDKKRNPEMKKRFSIKAIALLLVLVMTLSVGHIAVFADAPELDTDTAFAEAAAPDEFEELRESDYEVEATLPDDTAESRDNDYETETDELDDTAEYEEVNSEDVYVSPVEVIGNFHVLHGPVYSAAYVAIREFTVDFSLNPELYIFFVRTGYSGFTVVLTDVDGNNFTRRMNGANQLSPSTREWMPLWNVGNHTGIVTYQITVTVNGPFVNDCSFAIIIGTHEEGMQALSGPCFVVPLERFMSTPPAGNPVLSGNFVGSFIVPTGDFVEYYSFVARGNDTISFQSAFNGLRFEVIDSETGASVNADIVTSVDPNGLGRNHFTRAHSRNFRPGRTYYIRLYRASNHQDAPAFIGNTFALSSRNVHIAVGGPRLRRVNMVRFEANSTLRAANRNQFTDGTVPVSGLPQSAVVTRVELTFRGESLSSFDVFRFRNGTQAWRTSVGLNPVFNNVPFTYLGVHGSHTPANGTWTVGYRPWFTPLTFTPGILLSYYFELGTATRVL